MGLPNNIDDSEVESFDGYVNGVISLARKTPLITGNSGQFLGLFSQLMSNDTKLCHIFRYMKPYTLDLSVNTSELTAVEQSKGINGILLREIARHRDSELFTGLLLEYGATEFSFLSHNSELFGLYLEFEHRNRHREDLFLTLKFALSKVSDKYWDKLRQTREAQPLSELEIIRRRLNGFEDEIISILLERAQNLANLSIYEIAGTSDEQIRELIKRRYDDTFMHSQVQWDINEVHRYIEAAGFFGLRLLESDLNDALWGRFTTPEEKPFMPFVASPLRSFAGEIPSFAKACKLDYTKEILNAYLTFVPKLCQEGDDSHYGSSAEHDVMCLRKISRRIHWAIAHVAEAKLQQDEDGKYKAMIDAGDAEGIERALTNKMVESDIYRRVMQKVDIRQYDGVRGARRFVDPHVIADFFQDVIIPITKKGEVEYLLQKKADG